MSYVNFNELKICDDERTNKDIMKEIISTEEKEEPFYIFDIADIILKHKEWKYKMPRVIPHFAVKCNPHELVLKVLSTLNASFDCASEEEIKQVMQYGVSSQNIIFANPAKAPAHIKFARKVGVQRMTVDSDIELVKIRDLFPDALIVIRIRCDAESSECFLGHKFGCDPDHEAVRLIQLTMTLGLKLHGFSFHVGSPCLELLAYKRGIQICAKLIAIAKAMGCQDVGLIDIGGGIPGESGTNLDQYAEVINESIKDIDPSINIISEPGRYYVTSAFSLAACVNSKRVVQRDNKLIRMYFMNCGVYSSFVDELLDLKQRIPTPLFDALSHEKYFSIVWGPTCDSYDCILKEAYLPEYEIGDWLVWTDMGAYSIALASKFNGFMPPEVYPIIRKSQWEAFCRDMKQLQYIKHDEKIRQIECIECR